MNSDGIRLEILKKQSEGFSRAETVQLLKETYNVPYSTSQYHFKLMPKWIGTFIDLKNAEVLQAQLANIYWQVIREASFRYLQAKDDNARIGYLRTKLEATARLSGYLPEDLQPNSSIIIALENNLVVKATSPINSEVATANIQPITLEVTS